MPQSLYIPSYVSPMGAVSSLLMVLLLAVLVIARLHRQKRGPGQ